MSHFSKRFRFSITSLWRATLLGICAALLLMALPDQVSSVYAASTITVNSTADNLTASDGLCTLREAIKNANANADTTGGDCVAGSGADTIVVPAGTYVLGIPGQDEDLNATGDLDFTDANVTTINGASARLTIISANQIDRVINVVANASLTLNGVTVRDGLAFTNSTSREGSGIQMLGAALTINNVRITANTLPVDQNYDGAGINVLCASCLVTINNSLIDNNVAGDAGGGIDVPSPSTATIVTINNTTFFGNQAARGAAIDDIFGSGQIKLKHVTITGNTSRQPSGAITNIGCCSTGATYTIQNSINQWC